MWRRLALCHFVSFVFLATLIISGCTGKTVLTPPGPSTEGTAKPGVTPPVSEQVQPEQTQPEQVPPEPPPTGDEETQPEVLSPPLQPKLGPAASLYHRSEQHVKEGRFDLAEMMLERALRIEPRNPYYWHAMAEIRLGQGKTREAIQCCLKSNSLASGNASLISRNNDLINRAQAGGAADAGSR